MIKDNIIQVENNIKNACKRKKTGRRYADSGKQNEAGIHAHAGL